MNPQETQLLQDFLNQLVQAKCMGKDPQAEALILSAISQQADASYLLVQRSMLMDNALNQAKAQIASLQSQLQAAKSIQSTQPPTQGFLDANAWGHSPVAAVSVAPSPMMANTSAPYSPATQAPAASSGFFGGGVGNVLGTVAATAAGVVGGAFLFQGIEHMMEHNNSNSFSGQQHGMTPTGDTTINNYYGDDAPSNNNSDNENDDSFDDDS